MNKKYIEMAEKTVAKILEDPATDQWRGVHSALTNKIAEALQGSAADIYRTVAKNLLAVPSIDPEEAAVEFNARAAFLEKK